LIVFVTMPIDYKLKRDYQIEEIKSLIHEIELFTSEIEFFKDAPKELLNELKEKTQQLIDIILPL